MNFNLNKILDIVRLNKLLIESSYLNVNIYSIKTYLYLSATQMAGKLVHINKIPLNEVEIEEMTLFRKLFHFEFLKFQLKLNPMI